MGFVGAKVGLWVGLDVGEFVGFVGAKVGLCVGLVVGEFVGFVGAEVGLCVGLDVGEFVGLVGAKVGAAVGEEVGAFVGLFVGATVGAEVGAEELHGAPKEQHTPPHVQSPTHIGTTRILTTPAHNKPQLQADSGGSSGNRVAQTIT